MADKSIPDIPIGLVQSMMKASCDCVKKHPDKKDHPYLCENVYWSPLEDPKSFTLHTHTIGYAVDPSDADKNSTMKLKKSNLCIINTENKTLICWNKRDQFRKPTINMRLAGDIYG